ncbi:hypothetical protein OH492_28600 [Vibrio chagasii]|nr:hypothetical protein [Vibrio chagasii]
MDERFFSLISVITCYSDKEFIALGILLTKLTIIATIVCKEEKIEFVKSEMIKLIDKAIRRRLYQRYDLHPGTK